MADSITLLSVQAQPNVAPILAWYRGGEVPLADQKKTTPVDVSSYATLRLDLLVAAATNKHGQEVDAELVVTIEHAPTSNGPWKPVGLGLGGAAAGRFEPIRGCGARYVVLVGFDSFVRASWYYHRPGQPQATEVDNVALTFGVLGSAS
jgi:hypothetical protein